jgi:VIT1/CCC1 family predicted Fe2+/Mn2+ transporter
MLDAEAASFGTSDASDIATRTETRSRMSALNTPSRHGSLHVEPRGVRRTVQHYLRDLVYGANDGIITTFAVVAGVTGGALTGRVVLIVGAANLLADGLSMAVGNYLSIRSNESVRRVQALPEEESQPVRHAFATFLAFAVAGAVPLLPFVVSGVSGQQQVVLSSAATLAALFGVGSLRATVTDESWWKSGLEMFGLGVLVAIVAYGAGLLVAAVLST